MWLLELLLPAAGGDAYEAVVTASGLAEQRIVHRGPIAWPPAAGLAGVRGVVQFVNLVDEERRMAKAGVVGGHPLLVEAARGGAWLPVPAAFRRRERDALSKHDPRSGAIPL